VKNRVHENVETAVTSLALSPAFARIFKDDPKTLGAADLSAFRRPNLLANAANRFRTAGRRASRSISNIQPLSFIRPCFF
jgi:hypothetical protein